jgi:hypothetical protein
LINHAGLQLTEAEERNDGQNHHEQTHQVDDAMHCRLHDMNESPKSTEPGCKSSVAAWSLVRIVQLRRKTAMTEACLNSGEGPA